MDTVAQARQRIYQQLSHARTCGTSIYLVTLASCVSYISGFFKGEKAARRIRVAEALRAVIRSNPTCGDKFLPEILAEAYITDFMGERHE